MRYGLAIAKSLRSILLFCITVLLTLYVSHRILQYLFNTLSASQSWKLAGLVFTAVAPILTILSLHWKGRLREVNFIWILVLTTVSTLALFILWGYIVSTMNRA